MALWHFEDQRVASGANAPVTVRGKGGGLKKTAASAQHDRYNPVRDRLDEGTVVEDWIPRDPTQINLMYRLIFLRDEIAGPTIDLFAELPWSECSINGVTDPKAQNLYEDWLTHMDPTQLMPELTKEYLVIGRAILTLAFNDSLGYWDNAIVQDADFVKIEPIPIFGADPKLDMRVDPGMQRMLNSQDPRDIDALKAIKNKKFVSQMRQGGYIPLDPLNTVFIPRRSGANDSIGTSFLTRLLTWWALQKPLINASAVGARRKAGGTTHAKVGKENVWEPTPQDMQNVAQMIMQAEEDPGGGLIVTRYGVEIDRLDNNTSMWKLGDDYSFIAEGKMRALGVNEALLSGDANFTTMETALSVMLERIKMLRHYLTHMFLVKKSETLARINGFVKTKERDAAGPNTPAVRIAKDVMAIPKNELMLPSFEWHKKLQPVADENFLNVLSQMEEKGLPVSLRTWAAAGGLSLKSCLEEMDDDIEVRKKVQEYKKKIAPADLMGMDGMSGGMGDSEASVRSGAVSRLPVWDKHGRFMGLERSDVQALVNRLVDHPRLLKDDTRLERLMKKAAGDSKTDQTALKYVLSRVGLIPQEKMSLSGANKLCTWVRKNTGSDPRGAKREIALISAAANMGLPESDGRVRAELEEDKPKNRTLISGYIPPDARRVA